MRTYTYSFIFMLIWCLVNTPFSFLFFEYNYSFLGTMIFLIGFGILIIFGFIEKLKTTTRQDF
jgi:hypothetical protein